MERSTLSVGPQFRGRCRSCPSGDLRGSQKKPRPGGTGWVLWHAAGVLVSLQRDQSRPQSAAHQVRLGAPASPRCEARRPSASGMLFVPRCS